MTDGSTGLRALSLALLTCAALAAGTPRVAALAALPQDENTSRGAAADARADADAADDETRSPARGFEHVLPADTQLFFGLADLQQYGRMLDEQPWGRLWADPGSAALRTELESRIQELIGTANETLGGDLQGALDGLQGGLALAFTLLGPEDGGPLSDDPDDLRLNLMLVAGLADDHQELQRMIDELIKKSIEDDPEVALSTISLGEWDVTELHQDRESRPDTDLRYVFAGDTLIFELALGGESRLESVLDELEGRAAADGPGVLAANPRFVASAASRAGGLQLWIDARPLCELGRLALEKQLAEAESASDVDDPPNQFVAELMLDSGLLNIASLAASSAVDADGSRFDLHFDWPAGGWAHELAERLCVPGDLDALAACQADATSLWGMRMDFPGLFDLVLKQALATGEVEMSDVVEALSAFEAEAGFALRDDLLESLSGQVALATCEVDATEGLPGAAPGQKPFNFVLLLGLNDGESFNTLLEDLVRSRGLHAARERLEFQGFELFNVPVFPGFSLNYSVLPDMLVASLSPTLVQEVLRRRAGADLPSYADRKDLGALLARLSPGRGMLSTADAAQNAYGAVVGFLTGLSAVGGMQGPNPVTRLFADLPVPELAVFQKHFKGLIAVAATVDDTGITIEAAGP